MNTQTIIIYPGTDYVIIVDGGSGAKTHPVLVAELFKNIEFVEEQ